MLTALVSLLQMVSLLFKHQPSNRLIVIRSSMPDCVTADAGHAKIQASITQSCDNQKGTLTLNCLHTLSMFQAPRKWPEGAREDQEKSAD